MTWFSCQSTELLFYKCVKVDLKPGGKLNQWLGIRLCFKLTDRHPFVFLTEHQLGHFWPCLVMRCPETFPGRRLSR